MTLDTSRLGAWGDLPFFQHDLPGLATRIADEPRAVYPPSRQIFHALERTQPEAVKVVILGQDPYHTKGKADGLAFSITRDFDGRLDSLGNIFKELETDFGIIRTRTDLGDWADQGVLLLNTILTVPQGKAKGHAKLGWQKLTTQILSHLAQRPRAYLLWGNPAQKAAQDVDVAQNLKIETKHPSPLSAYGGFFGSRPFSRTDAWLHSQGHRPINWGDPESQK